MTKKPTIAEMMQARREGLPAAGVPQTDPIAALTAPPAPAVQPPDPPVPAATEVATVQPPATPAPAAGFNPADMLTEVDTGEQLRMVGFHMYPSRHEQLRQLAFFEKRRQWEIIEEALAAYVKKHYRKR